MPMKHVLITGAVVLFSLALATSGDAGGKKKGDKSDPDLPPRADEIPKYMKMLNSGNSKDRALAIHKIGLRGMVNANDVLGAIDPLRTALSKDGDAIVRKEAAMALGNIQPDPKDTVPLLTKTVKDDKVMDVRLGATIALGQYGAEAKEALPTLRAFAGEIKDKKSQPAQTVSQAIKMISGKKK
jgi:HEAT repeats